MRNNIIAAVFFIMLAAFGCARNREIDVIVKGENFRMEVASEPKTRARGLMHRRYLEKNRGMIFVFSEEGLYPFWMKNTLMPLDIIWVDSNKKVVYISKDNKPADSQNPPLIVPSANAKYVLEINAGLSEKMALSIGDEIVFNLQNE